MQRSHAKYNYSCIRIHRRVVRDLLLARLEDEGVPVYYQKFRSIVSETESSVTVSFEDGTEATGDFAVGCDGIHSCVQHYVYPESQPLSRDFMGKMGTVLPDQLTAELEPEAEHDTNRWPVNLPRMTFGAAGMFDCLSSNYTSTESGLFTTQRTHARSRDEWAEFEHDKAGWKHAMKKTFPKEKGGTNYPAKTRLLVQRARPETLTC